MEAPLNAVIGIVAHPARKSAAIALCEEVEAQYLSFDQWGQGERWNHWHVIEVCAMVAEKEGREWIVVLEDDAVPCDGFREKLAVALEDAAGPVGSLYLGTSRWAGQHHASFQHEVAAEIEVADREGLTDIVMPGLYHAVAVVLHVGIVREVLAAFNRSPLPTDQAVTDAVLHEQVGGVWYAHPSLVDHRDEAPVTQHPDREVRDEPRHAWRFAGREGWRSGS